MKKNIQYLVIAISCFSLLAGCSNANEGVIKIATKPMVEQYILGQILSLLIENECGYTVEITKGIAGGTSNIHPAMMKGEFDLYPEYTSTGYVVVLGLQAAGVSDEKIWDTLVSSYEENYNMTWIARYGFNNTYCIAVREDIARRYNLKTTSDLAAVAGELIFGSNPDYFEREDGFDALSRTYGLNFKKIVEIDIGLRWAAIDSGDIDVTTGFTTDAELTANNAVVLEDDLSLQVNYFCSTVVRNDTLRKYPKLNDTLKKMDGLINENEMSQLNYQVIIEERDDREVALDFLIKKGIISK